MFSCMCLAHRMSVAQICFGIFESFCYDTGNDNHFRRTSKKKKRKRKREGKKRSLKADLNPWKLGYHLNGGKPILYSFMKYY